jgi:hypothetical protein
MILVVASDMERTLSWKIMPTLYRLRKNIDTEAINKQAERLTVNMLTRSRWDDPKQPQTITIGLPSAITSNNEQVKTRKRKDEKALANKRVLDHNIPTPVNNSIIGRAIPKW